jgi:hypothetical protein
MTFFIGTPFTKGAGYFLNDKELRTRQEADVQTCSHCQGVLKMQEWKNDGAFCGKCMHPICGPCGTRAMTYGCEPFLQKIEQYAERTMRFEKFRKDAGLEPVAPQPIITGNSKE